MDQPLLRTCAQGKPIVNLVLEGGGVLGHIYEGVLPHLDRYFTVARIAGTSAGSMTGAFLAAGATPEDIDEIVDSLPLTDITASHPLLGGLPWPARIPFSMLAHRSLFPGTALREWLTETLAARGVETWGDLRLPPTPGLPAYKQYKLVVLAHDVMNGRVVKLPYDYRRLFGLDPDVQSVADAVYASCAVPGVFSPLVMPDHRKRILGLPRPPRLLVDGGVRALFPTGIFAPKPHRAPDVPTIGVRIMGSWLPVTPRESAHLHVINVKSGAVLPLAFNASPIVREGLRARGDEAAQRFINERLHLFVRDVQGDIGA